MNRIFSLVLGVVLLLGFQHYAVCAEKAKFGIVDIERFQDESKSFQKIKGELKTKFDALQKELDTKERKHGRASVYVSFDFDRSEPLKEGETPKPFELSILLKLSAEEDYFTLIDKAKITPNIKSGQENTTEGKK